MTRSRHLAIAERRALPTIGVGEDRPGLCSAPTWQHLHRPCASRVDGLPDVVMLAKPWRAPVCPDRSNRNLLNQLGCNVIRTPTRAAPVQL